MDEVYASKENSVSGTPAILMPLPDNDFDPTEASIPWIACSDLGWKVTISTEIGAVPQTDLNRLNGPLPGLIGAGSKAKAAYEQMRQDPSFRQPISYSDIDPGRYTALLLPGGDAPRMRQYLENSMLQKKVLEFCRSGKLVGAICHGILVLARTVDPATGRSVLYGHKLTVVPKSADLFAYRVDRLVTKHGYIMYANCVADEVRACLEHPDDIISGPGLFKPYVFADGNLITSRWYMDANVFAARFIDELQKRMQAESTV